MRRRNSQSGKQSAECAMWMDALTAFTPTPICCTSDGGLANAVEVHADANGTDGGGGKSLAPMHNGHIDDYFRHAATSGRAEFQWSLIRPALLWKLEAVIRTVYAVGDAAPRLASKEPAAVKPDGDGVYAEPQQQPRTFQMPDENRPKNEPTPMPRFLTSCASARHALGAAASLAAALEHDFESDKDDANATNGDAASSARTIGLSYDPLDEKSQAAELIERIMVAARDLAGIPFTFQRVCELLTEPLKHYKRSVKFLRAVEKTVNVVTCVLPDGGRDAGDDDEEEEGEQEQDEQAASGQPAANAGGAEAEAEQQQTPDSAMQLEADSADSTNDNIDSSAAASSSGKRPQSPPPTADAAADECGGDAVPPKRPRTPTPDERLNHQYPDEPPVTPPPQHARAVLGQAEPLTEKGEADTKPYDKPSNDN